VIRLSSETWDVTSVFEGVVEDVEEDLADVGIEPEVESEENDYGYTVWKSWSFSRLLGLYEQRVSLDYEEGRVSTGTYVSRYVFLSFLLAVCSYPVYLFLIPDLTESIFYSGIGSLYLPVLAVVIAAVGLRFESLFELEEDALLVSWFSSPYPVVGTVVVFASVFLRFSFLFSPVVSAGFLIVLLAGGFLKLLVNVYIPREETGFSKLLIIPFQAVFYRLLPFLLLLFVSLGPLAVVSGFDVSLGFYSELSYGMPLIGLASLFSDFTGSRAGAEAMATLYNSLPSLVSFFVVGVIGLVFLEYRSCGWHYRHLRNSKIGRSDSNLLPVSVGVFLVSNLLVLLFTGVTAVILVYAVTSLVLLPTGSTVIASTGFYSNVLVQPENLVRGSLVAVEQGLNGLNVPSGQVSTLIFYLVFLMPLFLTGILWVVHLASLYRQRIQYSDLESFDTELVPSDVVTVDSDFPVVCPVSTGLTSVSVLVSSRIIEGLKDEELEAVLRHEEYHIMNRDLLSNLIASVFALGFGGRNALLAFYGYPGIEREADQYAVKKSSKEALLSANREMYKLLNSFDLENEDLDLMEKFWKPFYRFYFGDFLLGTSNKSYTEREKAISDMEE
jgi:Zn-dependent protease with chaperone function